MTNFIKSLIPPIILFLLRRLKSNKTFSGEYATFSEALRSSTGYESETIAQEVENSLTSPARLTSQMIPVMEVLVDFRPGFRMVDIGGAGGSYYRSIGRYIDMYCTVVETPLIVDRMKSHNSDRLNWAYSPPEDFDIVLMSGVIQYLEDPKLFGDLVILNRVPIGAHDRIVIQHTVTDKYSTSYPARIFSKMSFERLIKGYVILSEWQNSDDSLLYHGTPLDYRGFYLRRET